MMRKWNYASFVSAIFICSLLMLQIGHQLKALEKVESIDQLTWAELDEEFEIYLEDRFDGAASLEGLDYTLNERDGHRVTIENGIASFRTAGVNMRKQFAEEGSENVVLEWKVQVPSSGSFATNLMHGGTSVVRVILFGGNWQYYNTAGERITMAPYKGDEWMVLRLEKQGGVFNAYMNGELVGENIPTLGEEATVNSIYYSLGSESALVDAIRVAVAPEVQPTYETGYFEPVVPVLENTNKGDPGEYLVRTEKELEHAIAEAVPGDVILMQDGVWTDIDILFKTVGTEERPITLRAQTRGGVVISGSSSLRISGQYLIVDGLHFKDGSSSQGLHVIEFRDGQDHAYHSRLTNVVISEFNKDRARNDSTDVWVGLFGAYNRVDHSFFHGKTSESVLMIVWRGGPEANYHRIDHNYFKDIPNIGLGGATAIRIGDGMQALTFSRTTIENNIFENMLGIGKVINIKSGENTIRNNTFVRASGSITIRQGNGNLIEGNVILPGLEDKYTGGLLLIGQDHIIRNNYIQGTRASGKAAITLYEGELNNYPGKGGYYPSKNVVIENNTLVDNDKNIIIGQLYDPESEITVPVENITFRKNVVLGNGNMTPMIIVLDEPNGSTYEKNQFFNGNFHGIEDAEGIQKKQPALQLTETGMYEYTDANELKDNQITAPLLRTEVGPEWIQSRWGELGVEDTPYIDLPVVSLIQETEMEAETEVEVKTDNTDIVESEESAASSSEETQVANEADEQSNNSIYMFWMFAVAIAAMAAVGYALQRRKSSNK